MVVPIAPGQTFDRYAIESLIGRGGMGEVYRATDTRLRRKVALKVLRPDRDRPDAVARLFREARAAAALSHPNTIAIHDLGESGDGRFYIVMELVTGAPLISFVGDPRVPLARKLGWLVSVAKALSAAHRAGVLHRDVKPSNVMVGEGDVVKVLDFGLAKPTDPVSFQSQVGHVLGTPRYMAPEALGGADADARSDQYAFGVTAYELVSGVHPGGAMAGEVPPPLSSVAKDAPEDLVALVAKTMAVRPQDRYPSMDDVASALDDVRAGRRLPIGGIAAYAPAARESADAPAVSAAADTARDDGFYGRMVEQHGAETVSAPAGASPSLAARAAADGRGPGPLRTLLSSEAPPDIAILRAAAAPAALHAGKTMLSPSAPAVGPSPTAAPSPEPRPAPAPLRAFASTPAPAPAAPRVSWMLVAVVAIVALACGVFAGSYFATPPGFGTGTTPAPKVTSSLRDRMHDPSGQL